jgi:hypothetical protein
MIKIIKFIYGISILVYLFVLVYVYAFLPDQVGLLYDDLGKAILILSKSDFFYAALGLFVVTNGIILIYRRLNRGRLNLDKTDFDEMSLLERTYHWLNGLSFIFNVILSFSILFIGMFNNSDDFDISNYIAFIYIGPILLFGWIFWFVYMQFSKR